MRKICRAIFSPNIYKLVLLVAALASFCPLIGESIAPCLKLLHLYAAAVIVFDLLGEKRILKNKGRLLLAAFVLFYCVTMLCNPELLSFSGVSFFAYFVETLLLVYSYDEGDAKREDICLFIGVLLITLTSVVGIVMFYTKFYAMPVYNRFVGMYPVENRLAGLFGNPNSLGLICMGAICLCFIRLVNGKRGWVRAFYAAALVINLVALLLSNCRTAIYSSVCMCALYVFLCVLRDGRGVVRVLLAVLAAAAVAVAGYFACALLQRGLSLLDVNYDYYVEYIMQLQIPVNGIDIDAAEYGGTIRRFMNASLLNGRDILWTNGARLFARQPLFGYGLSNYYQSLLDMGVTEEWASFSMHNSYLEALVSFGVAGFACAVAFLIVVLKNALVFFRYGEKDQWMSAACLLSCVAAFLAAGMMESALASPLSQGSLFFWIIMARLMRLLESENRASGHYRDGPLAAWAGRLERRK